MISSSEKNIHIGFSILRNIKKHNWFMSPEAVVNIFWVSPDLDTQRYRVSRSGRLDGRSDGESDGLTDGRLGVYSDPRQIGTPLP